MIKADNISYKYKDHTLALKDVSIDLNNGSKIALIGGNGAGKSTLFLNLMGILKPTQGCIYFNDKPLEYNKKYMYNYRQKVSMVFQDPDKQIFHSNVYDDVAFALRNIGIEEEKVKARVDEALMKTGAYAFKDKAVHYLSYGQKKRVAIAGIIALDSEIVLFDEPTAELDPAMTKGIIDIINKLSDEGKKVIISSHDMDLIYSICDYGYILSDREVIANGPIEDLFSMDDILMKANLSQPWLMKVHKKMGVPLFRNEESLFDYWSELHGNSSNRS
ncbi:ATP-binding cassette domain-containing protein [Alkalibaculum sp. M08DMB]|uniref:ABC transporter ATP-binding protein n=1 Tax=Alkalibaculum sporogenes TaxID=2655001 RepID=A0A6A7KB85_9FIRM|nr:ATP-binding cassette domain-containing protein [Alkalibaculum sporogenes]MPW26273.1 ATP-binding cassette domain-containing protein [Alkalibaculum sporogenes]